MDIKEKMIEITDILINIENLPYRDPNRKTYDKVGFVYDLEYLVEQLKYFYDVVVPEQDCINNPTKARYPLYKRPKEHQLAYFNLTRGLPKELFGGHLCYVLKDMGSKYLIIPISSVKKERPKKQYEINIEIKDNKNDEQTRLRVSEIRCVDKQRLYPDKPFFEIETNKKELFEEIKNIIGLY